MNIEYILAGAAVLILICIIANKVSGRLGVPALLIFIQVGMLAGSEGPGRIPFDDAVVAQSIGVVALVLILIAGAAAVALIPSLGAIAGIDTATVEAVCHQIIEVKKLNVELGIVVGGGIAVGDVFAETRHEQQRVLVNQAGMRPQ